MHETMNVADECAGCFRPIRDRFLLKVLDKPWHTGCVRCELCRKLLDEKCFYKEGKMYCKDDFYRCFGPKCGGCGEKIHYQDFVRKAREKVYHLRCFTCSICGKQLSTGEVLYMQPGDDGFVCRDHYLKQDISFSDDDEDLDDPVSLTGLDHPGGPLTATPPHLTPASSSDTSSLTPTSPSKYETNNNHQSSLLDKDDKIDKDDDDDKDLSDGGEGSGGKRRGPRTTIKAKQLEVLKTAFSQTPKPTRHIREQLAKETGLSMRVIQVWFQNKRSKERRMKQMTSGMMAGRGFFPPGKGGRRGFPMIGDDFGYFPHDKPFHDFGYPPNFGPPPPGDGFFPGPPLGFMGGHPGGPPPNMEPGQMHPLGPLGGPPQGPPHSGDSPFPPGSMLGGPGGGDSGDSRDFGDGMAQPPRPSPTDFPPNSGGNGNSGGFSSEQSMNEQMVW